MKNLNKTRVLILAAGRGSRLKDLTKYKPIGLNFYHIN